jgi:hypothetical protein
VKKKDQKMQKEKLKRKNKKSLTFNDKELSVINNFCKKYKITNQSKFMREAIITVILKKYDEDYPSLFDEPQAPSLFSQPSA